MIGLLLMCVVAPAVRLREELSIERPKTVAVGNAYSMSSNVIYFEEAFKRGF